MTAMQAFQPAPPAAISRVLAAFDRVQLEGFIEVAIGLLDMADGDADAEDAADLEDDFSVSPGALDAARRGAGCMISDPDFCVVERGDLTTLEGLTQGCGSAPFDDEDDEGRFVPVEWPVEA